MSTFFWDWRSLYPLEEVLKIQSELFDRKLNKGDPANFLIFAEHPHVYTYEPNKKSSSKTRKFKDLGDPAGYRLPAPLVPIFEGRGGSITYHGPGQIVCYMIIDTNELNVAPGDLPSIIDETIKETLLKLGIKAYTLRELCGINGRTITQQLIDQGVLECRQDKLIAQMSAQGVWVITEEGRPQKIASRGLTVKRGITKFGFAFNVSTDLSYFDYIYPCELNIGMESVLHLAGEVKDATTGEELELRDIARIMADMLIGRLENPLPQTPDSEQ